MPITYDLTGRAAVVTGGAQGIGRVVVERVLAGGGSAAIWDWEFDQAEKTVAELKAKGKVVALKVDVSDWSAVQKATTDTLSALGKIDILVNNAGINGLNTRVIDYPVDEWDRVIAVNLRSQFLCCKAIVPLMIAQNYGRIANIASIAGKEGNPNASAYSASKGGVIALTKSLGKETAEYNIAVNAIAPVSALTRMVMEQVTPEHRQYMLNKIPRGRFVTIEEISGMIAFMISEECSFTTGFTFDVSGGRATY